jgi:hypothetical protein
MKKNWIGAAFTRLPIYPIAKINIEVVVLDKGLYGSD